MMLNGGGTVPPSSKYEIQSLLRANFHSVSALSCSAKIFTVSGFLGSNKKLTYLNANITKFQQIEPLVFQKSSVSNPTTNHFNRRMFTLKLNV